MILLFEHCANEGACMWCKQVAVSLFDVIAI